MVTITALLRAKPGHGDDLRAALGRVADFARTNEPGTLGFYVCRNMTDELAFTTYERFIDQAAMDTHNQGAATRFVAEAGGWIDGAVTLLTGTEVEAVSP